MRGQRGRPAIYGERFNPRQIDAKYRVSTQIDGNLKTEIYQMELRHKKFPDPLNGRLLSLKTNLTTEKQVHVLLFSSDLELDDRKTDRLLFASAFKLSSTSETQNNIGVLEDFMNVKETPYKQCRELVNVYDKCIC